MPINFISTITEFVKPSNLFKKTTDCGLIKKIAASAVVAAGTLAMATTTVALDMTFTGASNNNWLDAANWSGGTGPAPTATDNVTIPNLKKAEIYASGSVVQGYAALVNVQSGGTIAIKGGPNPGDAALLHSNQDITNSGDIIIQGGAGNSNAFGVLYAFFNNLTNNNGATIQITAGSAPNAKASLNMYAGTLTNGGTINVSGGTGTSATAKLFSGPVTNNGTIHFKATGSDVMGGVRTFDNYGDLIVEGGTVAGVTAGVSVTGDLTNYNGGAITLTGGSANGASSCLTVKGNLTNKDGGDITVTAGSASNANVSLHVTGNLANETGGIVNLSGGHIMNVSASIQVDDDLENDGTINVTGGDNYNASATLNVGGDLTNNNGGIINLTSVSSSAHTK